MASLCDSLIKKGTVFTFHDFYVMNRYCSATASIHSVAVWRREADSLSRSP